MKRGLLFIIGFLFTMISCTKNYSTYEITYRINSDTITDTVKVVDMIIEEASINKIRISYLHDIKLRVCHNGTNKMNELYVEAQHTILDEKIYTLKYPLLMSIYEVEPISMKKIVKDNKKNSLVINFL